MKSNGTSVGSRWLSASNSSSRSRYDAIDSETSSSSRRRSRSWLSSCCAARVCFRRAARCRRPPRPGGRPGRGTRAPRSAERPGLRLPNPMAPSGRTMVVSGSTQKDSTPMSRSRACVCRKPHLEFRAADDDRLLRHEDQPAVRVVDVDLHPGGIRSASAVPSMCTRSTFFSASCRKSAITSNGTTRGKPSGEIAEERRQIPVRGDGLRRPRRAAGVWSALARMFLAVERAVQGAATVGIASRTVSKPASIFRLLMERLGIALSHLTSSRPWLRSARSVNRGARLANRLRWTIEDVVAAVVPPRLIRH